MWEYLLIKRFGETVFVIFGSLVLLAILIILGTVKIKEHKRRKSCELAHTCPRKGICMSCLNYKKKGEHK